MRKKPAIPAQILDRPFTWAEARALGVSWNEIQRQLKRGMLERVSRGVYRAPADDVEPEEQFRIATLRVGPESAVCLVSALEFYGLTDAVARAVWLLVPAEKGTRFIGVRLFRRRNPQLQIGVVRRRGYSITSVERTLAECLAEKRRIGTNLAMEALRRAVDQKRTTLSKIMDVASKLGLAHRIKPYIEALS